MKENIISRVPLKIYRRLRWEINQRKTYKQIKSNYGKTYADICYESEKAIFLNRSKTEVLAALKKKDEYIIGDIERKCSSVISSSDTYRVTVSKSRRVDEPIWVFWWTGEETAPEIVKACIKSIRRNANGHRVIFLSKDNLHDYVTLPDFIEKKHNDGNIGHAHYSDIVRISLLAEYGGVWIDSTVFISQPIPDYLFSERFYTARSVDNEAFYFSRSRWVGYFITGAKDFPLFAFVRDMLFSYWKVTDRIIAYLLLDYLFDIACRYLPEVADTINALPNNNLLRGELMTRINEPFSAELFDRLEHGDTFLSKLSWRYGSPVAITKEGKKTNYGHIIEL